MIAVEDVYAKLNTCENQLIYVSHDDLEMIVQKEGFHKIFSLDNLIITNEKSLFEAIVKHGWEQALKTAQGYFVDFEMSTSSNIVLITENMEYLHCNSSDKTDIVFAVGSNSNMATDTICVTIVLTGLPEDVTE
jgi:hypothetical protein